MLFARFQSDRKRALRIVVARGDLNVVNAALTELLPCWLTSSRCDVNSSQILTALKIIPRKTSQTSQYERVMLHPLLRMRARPDAGDFFLKSRFTRPRVPSGTM